MKLLIAGVVSALCLSVGASAQTPIAVEVTVTGSSPVTTLHANGADISLSLGTLTASTLVRVYDDSTNGSAPANSVGKIAIDGTNPSNYVLRVLVAGENQTSFPSFPDDLIDQGVINLGGSGTGAGIKVHNSSNPSDTSLRDRTRIAVGVSGDVTGTIHVAEVFRLQADNDILAAITATGTLTTTTGFDPITRVVAGGSLSGAIVAETGSIGDITAAGIMGDILAELGHIAGISSTGPIGDGSTLIQAGTGITFIDASTGADPNVYYDINATIVANANDPQHTAVLGGIACNNFIGSVTTSVLGGERWYSLRCVDYDGVLQTGSLLTSLGALGHADTFHITGDAEHEIYCQEIDSLIIDGNVLRNINIGSGGAGEIFIGGRYEVFLPFPQGCDTHFYSSGPIGVLSIGDSLGTTECPVLFRVASVDEMEVGGGFYGAIGPPNIPAPPPTIGTLSIGGDFVGSFNIATFDRIDIGGNVVVDTSKFHEFPVSSIMRIGGAFVNMPGSDIEIVTLPSLQDEFVVGTVIINANGGSAGGSAWQGSILFINFENTIEIAPGSSQPFAAPYYDTLLLGEGSVGTVPFHLHAAACEPPLDPQDIPVFRNSSFSNVPPASSDPPSYTYDQFVQTFYGFVRTDHATASPVFITRDGSDPEYNWAQHMTITVNRGSDPYSREITVHGNGTTHLLEGTYRVKPIRTAVDGQLLCDALLTSADVPVADFEYVFILVADCNRNGDLDSDEINDDSTLDIWPPDGVLDECQSNCVPDYNWDGNVDQDDVACIINDVAGQPRCYAASDPDFNDDGNVDQDDVAAVINVVAGGACP